MFYDRDERSSGRSKQSFARLLRYALDGIFSFWPQRLGALPAVLGGASFPRLDQPAWKVLVWHAGESLMIRPSNLAYFNQLAGGPSQGFRHLADSSLDWGHDLPALARWLGTNTSPQAGPGGVYLSYFGTARPEYYGVRATALTGFIDRRPPQPPERIGAGIYCVARRC